MTGDKQNKTRTSTMPNCEWHPSRYKNMYSPNFWLIDTPKYVLGAKIHFLQIVHVGYYDEYPTRCPDCVTWLCVTMSYDYMWLYHNCHVAMYGYIMWLILLTMPCDYIGLGRVRCAYVNVSCDYIAMCHCLMTSVSLDYVWMCQATIIFNFDCIVPMCQWHVYSCVQTCG